MHSRIFEIETAPVDEDTRITADHYIGDHWFVYNVADYVCADDDRAGSLDWLKETLAPASAFIDYFTDDSGNEGFVLHEGFQAAYFAAEFPAFQQSLQALFEAASPETFASGDLASKMFSLKTAYDDEFGFYVENMESGLSTLNAFLRRAQTDTPYYFGGTVDYHC